MTNGEKLQEIFPNIEIVAIVPNEIIVIKIDNVATYSNISFTYNWWNAEYKEPKIGRWIRVAGGSLIDDYRCDCCNHQPPIRKVGYTWG